MQAEYLTVKWQGSVELLSGWLQKQNSELAKTLADVLGSRVQQQQKVHTTVLQYLQGNTARQMPAALKFSLRLMKFVDDDDDDIHNTQ